MGFHVFLLSFVAALEIQWLFVFWHTTKVKIWISIWKWKEHDTAVNLPSQGCPQKSNKHARRLEREVNAENSMSEINHWQFYGRVAKTESLLKKPHIPAGLQFARWYEGNSELSWRTSSVIWWGQNWALCASDWEWYFMVSQCMSACLV